ncbi:MAG TPA: adenylate/guanylate cyclase domain-containing protein, partial [Acidimicrobiia bacterium]|nr:adenylate/guanylate cyclase domain-containing protein [Acidimicrobiia bacterium]
YDPEAPDAVERLTLLRLVLEHGATVSEVRFALAQHRLHTLAGELVVLAATKRATLQEMAANAGVDPEFSEHLWRAFGFADSGIEPLVCSEADENVLALFAVLAEVFDRDTALQIARTAGASLARMADAAIGAVRARVEAPMRTTGGDDVDVARTFVALATDLVPRLYPMIEAVHRRHLAQAGRRFTLWEYPASETSTAFAVVGFADLVGFTAHTQALSAAALDEFVRAFEDIVLKALAIPGARLVKLIGDEAMFVAGDADDAVRIAHAITRAVGESPSLSSVRIGVAAGELLVREGDVFGPTVNRAARLVAIAEPGSTLMDAEVASRVVTSVAVGLGTRSVPGFDAPLEVFRLASS